MRARLADHDVWWSEQLALRLAVLRLGLRFRELSRLENHMIFQGLIDGPGAAPQVPEARIIHYSGSMYPEHWARFMVRLEAEQAELARWLYPRGPIAPAKVSGNPASLTRIALRNLQYRLFAKRCVQVS